MVLAPKADFLGANVTIGVNKERKMNYMSPDNKWIGKPTIRPDGIEKVTGSAQYAADYTMPGMVWEKYFEVRMHTH